MTVDIVIFLLITVQKYIMFLEFHPNAQVIPLASTGAASRIVYENEQKKLEPRFELDQRFENDYTYSSLFRRLFHNHLKN